MTLAAFTVAAGIWGCGAVIVMREPVAAAARQAAGEARAMARWLARRRPRRTPDR